MSITINVTPTTGGSFTAAGVESGNISLTVGGGIGPPGAGNVALAAGDGITISSTANVATISSTVQGVSASNLADLADVDATAPTSGQVLEWNGTAWTPGLDSTLTLASTGGSDLGASTAGTSSEAARADHVHNLPALADLVGVSLGTPTTGEVLAYNGTAWAPAADNALTLSSDAGADLGTAVAGSAGVAARADHVHNLPTFADITNGTASVTGNLTLNASTGGVVVNGGTSSAFLTLNCEQNTHGVTIASPAHSVGATYTLTLPATAGSANQVLTTDGSGSLSWSNGTSGSAGISWSSVPSDSNANGTAGDVAYDSQGYFYLHDGTVWRRLQLATFGVTATERLLTETSDSLLSETGDYLAHDGNPAQITITSQPQNATTSGATAAFSVTATVSDSSTITYQWQEFTGTIWADISAATSSTLTLGGLTSGDNGNQYRVNVGSDTATTVTSDVVTLTVQTTSNWTQVYNDIDGAAAGYELGQVALNSAGNVAIVGEPLNSDNTVTNQGRVLILSDNGTGWGLSNSSAEIYGAVINSKRGESVDISSDGTKVVISTQQAPDRFVQSGGMWVKSPSDATGRANGYYSKVRISDDGNAVVQIYTSSTGVLASFVAYDLTSGVDYQTRLGSVVNFYRYGSGGPDTATALAASADCSVVAIGLCANVNNYGFTDPGIVLCLEYTGTAWVERGTDSRSTGNYRATLVGGSAGDLFGRSTSLSSNGNILAVGAPYAAGGGTQRGFARVYSWGGSAWAQLGSDVTGSANYDYAGWSVDLSDDGTRLAVGLRGHDSNGSNSGTTRLYDWNGSAWVQVGGDIEGDASNDYAGSFVSISGDGDRVAIGAPGNDDGGAGAGQVRVFEST